MRYTLAHIFAVFVLVSIALSLRAFWIATQNDAFAFFATIIIAILSGMYAGWLRGRLRTVIYAAFAAAIALSSTFALERVFHSPDAMFPRDRIQTYYFDDPQINLMAVVIYSTIAAVIGTLAGHLVSRFRDWLAINATNLGIIFLFALACGYTGYQFGAFAFPHAPREQLSFLSTILGNIFGIVWASTNRSFPMQPKNEHDAR